MITSNKKRECQRVGESCTIADYRAEANICNIADSRAPRIIADDRAMPQMQDRGLPRKNIYKFAERPRLFNNNRGWPRNTTHDEPRFKENADSREQDLLKKMKK